MHKVTGRKSEVKKSKRLEEVGEVDKSRKERCASGAASGLERAHLRCLSIQDNGADRATKH